MLAASSTSMAPSGREARLYVGTEAVELLASRAKVSASPVTCPRLFVTWAKACVKRKLVSDPEFRCRVALRDLRKAHSPQLQEVERRVHEARLLYEMHEHSALLEKLDADINGAEQAVASMSKFLTREPTQTSGSSVSEERVQLKQEHVRDLLPDKRADLAAKLQQRDALRADLTEYADLQASMRDMERLHADIGLTAGLRKLKEDVQRAAGKGRNDRGRSFEHTCAQVLQSTLLPMLSARTGLPEAELLVVKNIKLGMASCKGTAAEFDSVVCVRVGEPEAQALHAKYRVSKGSFVRVVAVVEMKRNPDDVGEAFAGYQRALSWLSGLTGAYDPQQWVSSTSPSPLLLLSSSASSFLTRLPSPPSPAPPLPPSPLSHSHLRLRAPTPAVSSTVPSCRTMRARGSSL